MKIGARIAALRVGAGLTQEHLAEYVGVTRQAVQKWESGAATPDLEKLVAISRRFHVTLDELIVDKSDIKTDEELRFSHRYLPNYATLPGWELYSSNILIEYEQLLDEGRDVAKYKKLAQEIAALPVGKTREDMADYLAGLMHREPVIPEYAFYEPSALEEIRACRKPYPFTAMPPADQSVIGDKVRGAWLGRIAGCLLGKPIEGIRTGDLNYLLKATGNYPLQRYIRLADLNEEIYQNCKYPLKGHCFADTIHEAPVDDDTNYTVMAAAKLIPQYGREFRPEDVARCWLDSQPKNAYCTAERVAFINFVNGYYPPVSAIYKNPFREWIGAQIRADYFGYINPGDPEAAADMAWRDASVSHVKNGIYGEMFVAAMLACAAVGSDLKTVILRGLAEIPARSRLHAEVTELISLFDAGKTADECIRWIASRYDENSSHHWCHTVSNALIVITALLYGQMDFGKTICLAVGCGFDTDCNGATAGSILGMMLGAASIPEEWTAVFQGKLRTSIFGVGTIGIDELCQLTLAHMA
ncbi:MAG TPA: ADP-ribosylglycohydrolase family protein [Clostridiales bacterium]|nr:ADP-ribosylglycohydrolase family protein [Clostridiales bacterium]